jgi:hypothetical protein
MFSNPNRFKTYFFQVVLYSILEFIDRDRLIGPKPIWVQNLSTPKRYYNFKSGVEKGIPAPIYQ